MFPFCLLWLNSPLPLLARSFQPLHNLFSSFHLFIQPFLCLYIFSIALFSSLHPTLLFPLFSHSYHSITLIDVAIRFRSRVDEEGAFGDGVDLLFALILIRVAYSWLTGPALKMSSNVCFIHMLINLHQSFNLPYYIMCCICLLQHRGVSLMVLI